MNIKSKLLLLVVCMCTVHACKMGPNYSQPEVDNPEDYRLTFPSGTSIADLQWWEVFGDTVLQNMIKLSLTQNRNLRIALARVSEAEAVTGVVKADLYPRINYGLNGKGQVTTEGGGVTSDGGGVLAVDYQVDLWGRIHRLNEAALEEFLATEEAYRATTITLVAAVAETYLLIRDLDNRLAISIATERTWQQNLDIVNDKFGAGIISEVDVKQAIILVEEAKATIEANTRLIGQSENALSILLGMPPQDLPRGLALYDQALPPEVPVGLPSELLSRRPDVLQAERRLHAQTARIGAAEALKYPQLTLTADLGMSFANPVVGFSALGAQIIGPILNSGAIKKGVEIEEARTIQLLNGYEQTVLVALKEVEDAMIAARTYSREYDARRRQLDAADAALELSWIRYNGGLTSYLEVLDLQRSKFNSQLKASETLQKRLTSTVNLYKALGGGWDTSTTNDSGPGDD